MILPDLSGITARIHWETCITFLPHCSHGSSLFSLFSSCLVVLMRSDSIKYQLFPDSIHQFSGLCGQYPDFAEISGFYKIPFHHPASTAAEDLVTGKILRLISCVYSAGRHKLKPHIRCCHRFDHGNSASLLCREEFHNGKTSFDRLCDF